jgi:hypothetical protein
VCQQTAPSKLNTTTAKELIHKPSSDRSCAEVNVLPKKEEAGGPAAVERFAFISSDKAQRPSQLELGQSASITSK